MSKQEFGGEHTERKLDAVCEYALAYLRALKDQPFKKIYIDGFAGSGERYKRVNSDDPSLFTSETEAENIDADTGLPGSAIRVARLELKFDQYIFVESNPEYADKLQSKLQSEFPNLDFKVENADINLFLTSFVKRLKDRVFLFLDPYGLQVSWETVKLVAECKKVDLCILIPISGLQRTLPKGGYKAEWANTLDRFFGTSEWRSHFYREPKTDQLGLDFESIDEDGNSFDLQRHADFTSLSQYMIRKMSSEFEYVSEKPIVLRNPNGVALFILCFAAGNKFGAPIAKRIANHICKKYNIYR
jgi:three-Cys-motif partner protein